MNTTFFSLGYKPIVYKTQNPIKELQNASVLFSLGNKTGAVFAEKRLGFDHWHGARLFFLFYKKAEIDFNEYENRLLKRESDDKVDIDFHINLLFEKRSKPHIHPTKEVVKTQGSCLSTTISKFSNTRFN